MRHIMSILLQNEAGALTRVASLFSTRGYNIETLSVAPTEDARFSRLTLVTHGSDQVVDQISKQLLKLVDVVNMADMTGGDHIERELLLLKARVADAAWEKVAELVKREGARVLDDNRATPAWSSGGPSRSSACALPSPPRSTSRTCPRARCSAIRRAAPSTSGRSWRRSAW